MNDVLSRYGRFPVCGGKALLLITYYHFSDTINSVSAKRPMLRRSLQQAWDLCAMWMSLEPCEHHQAMPVQVLLAALATCLVWGWTREAAIFAMSCGMLLRIGEVLSAKRSDVVFPQDVDVVFPQEVDVVFPQDVEFSIDKKILEPKTRFRAARHQSSRLEPPDLGLTKESGLSLLLL